MERVLLRKLRTREQVLSFSTLLPTDWHLIPVSLLLVDAVWHCTGLFQPIMAITCGRLFLFVRSIFVPAAVVTAFGLLLTWVFILYQPIKGPGEQQRMGWQAWDIVNGPSEVPSTGANTEESGNLPEGVDWWNVTSESKPDVQSLPLDKWNPLLPHVTGCEYREILNLKCFKLMLLSDRNYNSKMCSASLSRLVMLSKDYT